VKQAASLRADLGKGLNALHADFPLAFAGLRDAVGELRARRVESTRSLRDAWRHAARQGGAEDP
jgi:hypothetical protein